MPFNRHDFIAVCQRERWQDQLQSPYHIHDKLSNTHSYSQKVVSTIIDKVGANPDYLKNVKNEYSRKRKSDKAAKTKR